MGGVRQRRHVGFTNEIRSEQSEDQFVRPSLPRAVLRKDLDLDRSEVSKREHHAMSRKNEPLEDIMMINSAHCQRDILIISIV
jgi:hypothetical protein